MGIWICSLSASLAAEDLWFEGGPVYRGGMKVRVNGSSYVQSGGLHDPAAPNSLIPPVGVGPANSYADRTYSDGYVKMDPGTGNSGSPDPNTTWNWGYNDASQYDPGAQTLSFHSQGIPGYTKLTDRAVSGSSDMDGGGLHLVAGLPLRKSKKLSISVTFGFQGIWASPVTIRSTPYREDVRQTSVTDTYSTAGISSGSFP